MHESVHCYENTNYLLESTEIHHLLLVFQGRNREKVPRHGGHDAFDVFGSERGSEFLSGTSTKAKKTNSPPKNNSEQQKRNQKLKDKDEVVQAPVHSVVLSCMRNIFHSNF